jgi:photosystem II stability/assembly factor-like uncharacterized protein
VEAVRRGFAGGAAVFFLDRFHGWANWELYHSSSVSPALLLASQDGGKTWTLKRGAPERAGSLCFFSETDGLLAGGPQDTELWVTHDASKSWQQLSLRAPPTALPASFPTYGEPICETGKRGFLPVTYSGPDGSRSALVLFATDDGARVWRADRVLPHLDETSLGQRVPSTVVGAALIAATTSGGTVTLALVSADGESGGYAQAVLRSHPT